MVGRAVWPFLLLMTALAASVWAAPGPGPLAERTAIPAPDTTLSPDAEAQADPAEVDEVLTELDAAGAPVSTAEIAELLAAANGGAGTGDLLVRGGLALDQAADQSGRANYHTGWLTAKGRWRRDREGLVEAAGAVLVGPPPVRVALGQLGIAHGFGLLASGPGRGRTLTADGRLGPGANRWVPWTGSPTAQALRGGGAQVRWRRWQGRGLVGSRPGLGASAPSTVVLQAGRQSDRWELAGLYLADPAERGASLTGSLRQGKVEGAWETAWRFPAGASRALHSVLTQLGWRPLAAVRFEMLAGSAEPGPRPVMGRKDPVMGDWAGRGFACRTTWRVVRGLGVRLLFQRGHGLPESFAGERQRESLTDLQVSAVWPGGWQAVARQRTSGTGTWSWSERFPWQAPQFSGQDERRVTSLTLAREGSVAKGQVLWRRQDQGRILQGIGREGGTRSLLGISGVTDVGRSLRVRGGWTMAWGDPLDLVSAVVPYAGYVVPRHWGQWRSEHIMGLEGTLGAWRSRCALSWRQSSSDPPGGGGGAWALWAESSLRW